MLSVLVGGVEDEPLGKVTVNKAVGDLTVAEHGLLEAAVGGIHWQVVHPHTAGGHALPKAKLVKQIKRI